MNRDLEAGIAVTEILRKHGITVHELRRLRELEAENAIKDVLSRKL